MVLSSFPVAWIFVVCLFVTCYQADVYKALGYVDVCKEKNSAGRDASAGVP